MISDEGWIFHILCWQIEYIVTPLQGITKNGAIASNITSAVGCTDGPKCK
jgi:hypothetical protein